MIRSQIIDRYFFEFCKGCDCIPNLGHLNDCLQLRRVSIHSLSASVRVMKQCDFVRVGVCVRACDCVMWCRVPPNLEVLSLVNDSFESEWRNEEGRYQSHEDRLHHTRMIRDEPKEANDRREEEDLEYEEE